MTYSNGVNKVLGEQNALELDQDEINELLKILQHGFDRLLGNGVVFARAERSDDALLQGELTTQLGESGDY